MMKNILYTSLLVFVVSACKFHRIAADEKIKVPASYEPVSQTVIEDSLGQASTAQLQDWKNFFTDALLRDLIDTALIANYDIQIAYQRLQQSRAGVQYTKGIRLPDLNLNLGAGVRKFGDYTVDGIGNYDTQFSPNLNSKQQLPNPIPDFYAGLSSSWEIDIWGKLKNKKKAAFARYLASEQGRTLVSTNVIAEIAQNYYALMFYDKELEIIKESLELQNHALLVSEVKKSSGKANELAVEMMKSQILGAKTMLIEIQQQIIMTENKLNMLLGRYPQDIPRSTWNIEDEITQNLALGIPSDLLMNRPDIVQAFRNLDVSNAELVVAKTAFYPSLQINANLGYQALRATLLFDAGSLAYGLIGNLVSPLLNRRELKAQLMERNATKKESYIQLEKTIVNAFTEVFELMEKSKNLDDMKSLKSEQVSILEKSVETSMELFTSGRATYIEVINAQQGYLRAQIELMQIAELKNKNQILLYKSLGGGA